jgi:glyoxylase-like metal-dependent hydrolase (beta-lactamase superfamily II)
VVTKEAFRFKIGEFDCISLNDGYHDYRIETFFANVDRRDLEKALRSRNWPIDRVSSPYASLYVDTGEHHVLVDTGAGDFFPTTGRLPANLGKVGVDLAEIDKVVITHAHPDHIGGLLNVDGTPTYPNARVYTMEIEWDFWLAEDALEKAPGFEDSIKLAHKVFDTMGDRFSFVQPDNELVPGIRVLAAFGHTPGHIAIEASSSDESVIYIGDAVFHPLHIEHPDWLPDARYIVDSEQFQETACRLLSQAVAKNALVLGMHFPPFPCLGHIIETGEGLQWQPVLVSQ